MAVSEFDALERVIESCRDEIARAEHQLGKGSADSFEKYREMVGVIRGLRHVESFVVDLYKKLESY
jgi:hypothetical protein